MRWFGEPWPSPEMRAEVCKDDADKIQTPDAVCFYCEKEFDESSQGVELPYLAADHQTSVVYIHIQCLIDSVVGQAKDAGYKAERQ